MTSVLCQEPAAAAAGQLLLLGEAGGQFAVLNNQWSLF